LLELLAVLLELSSTRISTELKRFRVVTDAGFFLSSSRAWVGGFSMRRCAISFPPGTFYVMVGLLIFYTEQVFDAVPHKKDSEDTPNLIDKMSDD
jgi:hypothetical protein